MIPTDDYKNYQTMNMNMRIIFNLIPMRYINRLKVLQVQFVGEKQREIPVLRFYSKYYPG